MLAKLLIVPVVIAIGFIGWTVITNRQPSYNQAVYSSPTPQATSKTFTASPVMDGFTIQIPQGYIAEEKFGEVIIKGVEGQITINQNGTNFTNIEEYIKNSKNDIENRLSDRGKININGLPTIYGNLGQEKIYFIYSNYNVFVFASSNPNLFAKLDQIAQSFTLPK